MFERELTLFRFTLRYLQALVADVPAERFAEQPIPGLNHPLWVVGHLALVSDNILRVLGKPNGHVPAEWAKMFGGGSDPANVPQPHPGKAELLDALAAGYKRLDEAVSAEMSPEVEAGLTEPHAVGFVKGILPTKGDLLAHVLTTHGAVHAGQLSAWRRFVGLPPVSLS